ncbi:putative G-patch domain protein [Aspergillus stella-maris]|uniref:putative G-patch domain protein n=1 Tax=Aspergillus stella-maris TaxID=1810926 RepID=UPI003CCDD27A
MSYEDEDYFLPLEDQRVFGAGITKKRVPFVRSSDHELSTLASSAPATPASTGSSIANTYLSIVMKTSSSSESTLAPSAESETATPFASTSPATPDPPAVADSSTTVTDRSHSALPQPTPNTNEQTICEVCNLSLASSTQDEKYHESSLAHQVCLTHSHPPSHLDRKSHGLRYLESYGWDPDSRLGLGAEGREGIRVPVKGKMKADTVGLGAVVPISSSATKKRKEKVQKLNAKQVRKGHFDARRKGDKLRELFYQDDEVLRHLGKG